MSDDGLILDSSVDDAFTMESCKKRTKHDNDNKKCTYKMDEDIYDYEGEDDDDDDDDDGVNITITSPSAPSLVDVCRNKKSNELLDIEMSNDVITKPSTTITSTTIDGNEENTKLSKVIDQAEFNATSIIEDIGLREELNKLVTNSIILSTLKCITVKYNNQIILISSATPISSRLASIFWAYPKIYVKQQMPFLDEFNKIIANSTYTPETMTAHDKYGNEIYRSSKYAVFSVKYKKNFVTNLKSNDAAKTSDSGNTDTNIIKPDGFKKPNTGIYHYLDFAAVIIENGKIIDYAIHGYVSNIAEMIHIHKPTRVYYNARRGDALDVFMNYQYQPFYEACYGKLTPVIINRTNDFFNPLPFCERQDIYCALCNCLRDVRGLLFKLPEQISVVNNNHIPYESKQLTHNEYIPYDNNNNIATLGYTYNEYQYQPYYQLEPYPMDYHYYYPQMQQYPSAYSSYYESTTIPTQSYPMPVYSPTNIDDTSSNKQETSTPLSPTSIKSVIVIPASSSTPSLSSSSSSTNTVRSVHKYTRRQSNIKDCQQYKYNSNKRWCEKFINQQQNHRYTARNYNDTRQQYQHQHQHQQQQRHHNHHNNQYEQQQQQQHQDHQQLNDRYKYYLNKYRNHKYTQAKYDRNPFKRVYQIGKNHLMQPDYNTHKRRIQYALKKPGAFNGFRNERQNWDSKKKY
ncbi:GrBNV gp78-like protein-like protein [Mauternbach virus]|uniref:GrBNV gp78-like protein-like protein n=1 Tax=Mauternbach virus TaxID=2486603 RepID=A0A3G3E611_9VIRU|nr:GrBNV gp78-like protein-like protein [Mauternbach virus]AYP97902.1 GrBNV gp78-like protein-like protein [Mauternbach virus]